MTHLYWLKVVLFSLETGNTVCKQLGGSQPLFKVQNMNLVALELLFTARLQQ